LVMPGLVDWMQERSSVVGLGDAEVGEVEGGVVTAGGPDRAAIALFERQIIPALAAGLAGACNGIEAPGFGACSGIERDDVVAAGR